MRHARRSALVTAALAVLVVAYALACAGLWRARGEWILREDCEIDFAHDYAFDALRIGEGVPPGDEYRGPLYPALLAFLHSRGAGLVRAGAWITVGSSLLALVLTFLICRRATGSGIFALAAASALALFPPFLKCSLLLGTDMLFAALLLSSVCLILPPGGPARAGAGMDWFRSLHSEFRCLARKCGTKEEFTTETRRHGEDRHGAFHATLRCSPGTSVARIWRRAIMPSWPEWIRSNDRPVPNSRNASTGAREEYGGDGASLCLRVSVVNLLPVSGVFVRIPISIGVAIVVISFTATY